MIWFGGGGREERNLKGRLEPGTSVVNGSKFDNIRRRWGQGRREGDGMTSLGSGGFLLLLQRLCRQQRD